MCHTVSSKAAHWFLERRFLKFLTIYGHGINLGHVISIIFKIFFISLYILAYVQNLVKNGPVVSEKSKF